MSTYSVDYVCVGLRADIKHQPELMGAHHPLHKLRPVVVNSDFFFHYSNNLVQLLIQSKVFVFAAPCHDNIPVLFVACWLAIYMTA